MIPKIPAPNALLQVLSEKNRFVEEVKRQLLSSCMESNSNLLKMYQYSFWSLSLHLGSLLLGIEYFIPITFLELSLEVLSYFRF